MGNHARNILNKTYTTNRTEAATFMVLPVSAAGPGLNPVETARDITTGIVIDESPETGGS